MSQCWLKNAEMAAKGGGKGNEKGAGKGEVKGFQGFLIGFGKGAAGGFSNFGKGFGGGFQKGMGKGGPRGKGGAYWFNAPVSGHDDNHGSPWDGWQEQRLMNLSAQMSRPCCASCPAPPGLTRAMSPKSYVTGNPFDSLGNEEDEEDEIPIEEYPILVNLMEKPKRKNAEA
jgi:hypothetical protein